MFTFERQLKVGQEAEQQIADWLSPLCHIQPTEMPDQRRGIDMLVATKADPVRHFTLEVKLDTRAARNGFVYLEVALPGRPGWAYTCQADILALVYGSRAKFIKPSQILAMLPLWEQDCARRRCENADGYWSEGLIVPLQHFIGPTFYLSEAINPVSLEQIMVTL